jgi:hypothetical protein
VVGDGDGDELPSAASLEEEDFASLDLCGLSLSPSGESEEPVCAFAEDEALDFCLFAVRDVDRAEDFELVFAPLGDLELAELFVAALPEVLDFVWSLACAFDSSEVV